MTETFALLLVLLGFCAVGYKIGSTVGERAAEERIALELARQQVLYENKADVETMREVEARQERIRKARLRWVENIRNN